MTVNKRVHVAVGVIIHEQQILLAKRHGHLHQGGKWEFPGGKVEAGEDTATALNRELQEEVGLTVTQCVPFMQLSYDYPDKQVFLDIMTVTGFEGEATGVEGQQIAWVDIEALPQYQFPDANMPILEKILKELR
ncbi:8-oxo-dGTP diphosphatase MutT [Shewanella dokdonensis]|uniref:8-oxo-dGTP diphosphatase n=1 Tax=Shewanella dokdonensis TaxID=712036 RepID=A0ABX8DK05_9GAMM|nr:8-oxo-dGTP diphosphatase MutT [Shewanella dokdonensis]MCL1076296.1 8-oxo-dGTP diphosphatase MutT [Shewanella dokdonensis]QVK24321.1 8-oxo-dGTP diphosphatase MutT [Shewanella dokdonensis]